MSAALTLCRNKTRSKTTISHVNETKNSSRTLVAGPFAVEWEAEPRTAQSFPLDPVSLSTLLKHVCSTTSSSGSPNGCNRVSYVRHNDRLHCHLKWISNYIHIFLFARGLTTMKNDWRNRNDFRFEFFVQFSLLSLHWKRNFTSHTLKKCANKFDDGCATHTYRRNSIIHSLSQSVSDNFWRSNLIGCHTIFVFICLQQKFWNKNDSRVFYMPHSTHGSRRFGILCQTTNDDSRLQLGRNAPHLLSTACDSNIFIEIVFEKCSP